MQTIFKKGYQRQEINAVPIRRNDNNIWNTFSCSYEEVDFIRYKYKDKIKNYSNK